jgi:hypothetical protein
MLAAGAAGGQMYDLTLFAPNNLNGTIAYQVDRIGTAYSATGTITPATPGTQTPASNILLAPRFWRSNNATALAVGMDISSMYIEADN